MFDPVAETEDVGQKPISPRLESLENARIGLFDNGKPAAEPALAVIGERLQDRYPDVEIVTYAVEHLNRLKNDDVLDQIGSWADDETDACIGAIGDCGSCTKFLVYGVNAIERSGTPAVGLIDSGFALDWEMNSRDLGRPLRQHSVPEYSEVTDIERVRERITDEDIDELVARLTTPRTEEELGDGDR
ncbi:UGSC family (seleno)protein [Halosolutus halophilus]|uniref:UGSC family (seleno)protein n=1 Tax=Halosolutus halophilus TaxID=1552990 RepID=UPI0022352DA5|nr:hypothetical protein [Halosolutus halophilus]